MLINKNGGNGTPAHSEAYYEIIASQEQIYLEEIEEKLRAILISYDPYSSRRNGSASAKAHGEKELDGGSTSIFEANLDRCLPETPDEYLQHIAEELITGDSDDPPICAETVVEMLNVSLIVRRLGLA